MNILTLQLGFHDDSAVLISGNKIWAIELERLSRIKHNCLQNVLSEDYAAHCLGRRHVKPDIVHTTIDQAITYLLDASGLTKNDIDIFYSNRPALGHTLPSKHSCPNPGLHHENHASAAFYPSGFEESAVLVIDVFGTPTFYDPLMKESVSFWSGRGRQLKNLKTVYSTAYSFSPSAAQKTRVHKSPGVFYMDFTMGCGFGLLEAGKTMGLSAYGTNRVLKQIEPYITFDHKSCEVLFDRCYRDVLPKEIEPGQKGFDARADIAFAAQKILERVLVFYCEHLYKMTGCTSLCFGGGLALNCAANGLIAKQTAFDRVFIQPAAKDSGNALGSALSIFYHFRENKNTELNYKNFCLGREYSDKQVADAIGNVPELYSKEFNEKNLLLKEVSKLIGKNKIIAWFQNGSEFGPRALGNRSILCNPALPKMKDRLNRRIKFRESFRPFAPVVLEEEAKNHFKPDHPSPYMLKAAQVKQSDIPAATHVDGTARVQTVRHDQNPLFYDLLKLWQTSSGLPVLLNTSFNIKGEPIVETPEDALDTFMRSDMDFLVIKQYLLAKQPTGD